MAEAVDAVLAIEDDAARARAITELLKHQAEAGPRLREERRQLVVAMREQGTSFRKIAAQLGVSLGTVQDILRGHSGPWADRPKSERPE